MARKFVVSVDLNKNELQNARIQNLSSAPSSPVAGQLYYDTSDNIMYFYNGTSWISTSGSLEVIQDAIGAYISGGTGLTATYNDTTGVTTIDLDNTTVTAGEYGSASQTLIATVDAQGRLTSLVLNNIQIGTSQVTGLEEFIEDTVGQAVTGLARAGEGIDLTYDDNAGTLTIDAEIATDTNRGVASFDSTDFTVTSGAVTLNAERVQDIVGSQILGGTGIDATYNDGAGTLSIDIDSTVATLTGEQTLTNKTLGSTTTLGANLNANNYKITGLAAPTDGGDAVNKTYVDEVAQGLAAKPAVDVATTANISATYANGTSGVGATLTIAATATLDIDGKTSWVQYDSVLFKNQTNKEENGRYVLTTVGGESTAWVFTRCGLCDEAAEIPGAYIFVTDGTINHNTGWVLSVDNPATFTVGTDDIDVYQFSGAGTYTGGAGLVLDGTTFNVGQGTGITVNANDVAINTTVVARKYVTLIGNTTDLAYTVTHNLNNRDAVVQILDATTYYQVEADVNRPTADTVQVSFASAPGTDAYRVVVIA